MAGRPTDCTPDIAETVSQLIIDGLSNRDAAALAGISESSFYEWLKRGREELERRESPRVKPGSKQWGREQPFVEFAEKVKKAIPRRKQKHLKNIDKAATNGIWQASAWLLERLHPDEFGRRDRLEATVRTVDLTADDLAQAQQEIGEWNRERSDDPDHLD